MEQKRAVLPLQKIEPVMKSEAIDTVLPLIELSSSDSESNDSSASFMSGESISRENNRLSSEEGTRSYKKRKLDIVLPAGFLDPLPPDDLLPIPSTPAPVTSTVNGVISGCKQFWKAGDYEVGVDNSMSITETVRGMDHVRVHPKFLHSNATSHKWALGAFAELLDNSLDETCNGATYSSIDMIESKKVGGRMLLIEDNGGGMDPDKMRHCMSLGYSEKSKLANTIGQYGNGFKTSTMRLGADVIVFSRCRQSSRRSTQTIGLLSYTFLRKTCKEDIVVPMLDYEIVGNELSPIIRSSSAVWKNNMETILHWSPYSSEEELLQQASVIKDHGTRIMIYNLWEDDEGQLELDFESDLHDIQIRGVNRDEKNIQMAKQFPNSKHFLTYKHSLRNYVSILYLRIPPGFRIMLRGKDVEHHNIVNDMMMSQEISYRPQAGHEGANKESNMVAVVRIGFVKDAKFHIDVQGFNVYHKNRLIKPFWRIWNAAGSDGRGVIGVLEANFVEPAHDKQGFERTTVLSRLESRLQQMQKSYWATNCHKIGYAPRSNKKEKDPSGKDKTSSQSTSTHNKGSDQIHKSSTTRNTDGTNVGVGKRTVNRELSPTEIEDEDDDGGILSTQTPGPVNRKYRTINSLGVEASSQQFPENSDSEKHHSLRSSSQKSSFCQGNDINNVTLATVRKLEEEKLELNERLKKEEVIVKKLKSDLEFERHRCKSLQKKVEEVEMRSENMNKEQESLIDIFSEERGRRDAEEAILRKKLADASNSVQELLDRVRLLEKMKSPKRER